MGAYANQPILQRRPAPGWAVKSFLAAHHLGDARPVLAYACRHADEGAKYVTDFADLDRSGYASHCRAKLDDPASDLPDADDSYTNRASADAACRASPPCEHAL